MIRLTLFAVDSAGEVMGDLGWSSVGALIGFITGALWGRYGWRRN